MAKEQPDKDVGWREEEKKTMHGTPMQLYMTYHYSQNSNFASILFSLNKITEEKNNNAFACAMFHCMDLSVSKTGYSSSTIIRFSFGYLIFNVCSMPVLLVNIIFVFVVSSNGGRCFFFD